MLILVYKNVHFDSVETKKRSQDFLRPLFYISVHMHQNAQSRPSSLLPHTDPGLRLTEGSGPLPVKDLTRIFYQILRHKLALA